MSCKYWVQKKAPAGNWVDSLGSHDFDDALRHAAACGEEARVIERSDKVLSVVNAKPSGPRPLHVIAREIRSDWKKVYFGAVPYLNAMMALDSISDNFGYDSAKSIVLYFLGNAQGWRGEVAKRVKAELKALVK